MDTHRQGQIDAHCQAPVSQVALQHFPMRPSVIGLSDYSNASPSKMLH